METQISPDGFLNPFSTSGAWTSWRGAMIKRRRRWRNAIGSHKSPAACNQPTARHQHMHQAMLKRGRREEEKGITNKHALWAMLPSSRRSLEMGSQSLSQNWALPKSQRTNRCARPSPGPTYRGRGGGAEGRATKGGRLRGNVIVRCRLIVPLSSRNKSQVHADEQPRRSGIRRRHTAGQARQIPPPHGVRECCQTCGRGGRGCGTTATQRRSLSRKTKSIA